MKIYEVEPGEKLKFEPSNTDTERSFGKFLADCSESIAAMQEAKGFLYRGLAESGSKNKLPSIFLGRPRLSRSPMDTQKDIQQEFDSILTKNGFTATRSNSIFCSGNVGQASSYGSIYLIFPKNGYQITWSSLVKDFTNDVAGMIDEPKQLYHKELVKSWKLIDELDILEHKSWLIVADLRGKIPDEVMNEFKAFYDNTVKRAIYSITYYNPEVFEKFLETSKTLINKYMPTDKELLANYNECQVAFKKMNVMMNPEILTGEEVLEKYKFHNNNLAAAITARKEIMVHGEYYAFSKKYETKLKKALLKK